MKRLLMVLAVFPLVLIAAGAQEQKKIDEFKMITYQAVFVTKGQTWTDANRGRPSRGHRAPQLHSANCSRADGP